MEAKSQNPRPVGNVMRALLSGPDSEISLEAKAKLRLLDQNFPNPVSLQRFQDECVQHMWASPYVLTALDGLIEIRAEDSGTSKAEIQNMARAI